VDLARVAGWLVDSRASYLLHQWITVHNLFQEKNITVCLTNDAIVELVVVLSSAHADAVGRHDATRIMTVSLQLPSGLRRHQYSVE
jgi:hypothetical protein